MVLRACLCESLLLSCYPKRKFKSTHKGYIFRVGELKKESKGFCCIHVSRVAWLVDELSIHSMYGQEKMCFSLHRTFKSEVAVAVVHYS